MIKSIDRNATYTMRSLAAACEIDDATILRFINEGMPAKVTRHLKTGKVNRKYREIKGEDAIKFLEWRRDVYSLDMLSLKTGYDTDVLKELVDDGFLKTIRVGKKAVRYVHVEDIEKLKEEIARQRLPQPAKRNKFKGNMLFDYLAEARERVSADNFRPDRLEPYYKGISNTIYRRYSTFASCLDAAAAYFCTKRQFALARRLSIYFVYAERSGIKAEEIEILLAKGRKKGLALEDVLKDYYKPDLPEQAKEEIIQLTRIIPNAVLAREYGKSQGRITGLAVNVQKEPVTRVAFSDRRIELAIPIYNSSKNERVRRIIRENVFEPLAKDIAQHVADAPNEFFTPYYGLYAKLFGVSKEDSKKITEAITQKVSKYVVQLLAQYSESSSELPVTVRNKEETITQWVFRKSREHFAAQFPKNATKELDKMLNILSPREHIIITLRYQLSTDLSRLPYHIPIHKEIAKAAGVHYTSISDREKEIIGRLMYADNISKAIEFIDAFKNYLRRCNAKPAA